MSAIENAQLTGFVWGFLIAWFIAKAIMGGGR